MAPASDAGSPIRLPRFCRDEVGTTTVEFAIVAMVLTIVFFGVFQFGIASYRRNVAAEAARFGARWAMVRGWQSGLYSQTANIQDTIRTRMAESQLTASVAYYSGTNGLCTTALPAATPAGSNVLPGTCAKVTVSYPTSVQVLNRFRAISVTATATSVVTF